MVVAAVLPSELVLGVVLVVPPNELVLGAELVEFPSELVLPAVRVTPEELFLSNGLPFFW